MKVVPQSFFINTSPYPHTYHDGDSCILYKKVSVSKLSSDFFVSCPVLTIVLKGKKMITPYDGEPVIIKENEMTFIPKDLYMIQDIIAEEGTFESWLFFFNDELIHTFLKSLASNKKWDKQYHVRERFTFPVYPFSTPLTIFTNSLLASFESIKVVPSPLIQLKLLELLHLMMTTEYKAAFLNHLLTLKAKRRSIKSFMQTHYDKPLKVEDYAYLTGRSLTSFLRDFKEQYQVTPKQWLTHQRMKKAQDILSNGKYSVTEVAYQVGYENLSHFIKAFKANYGISPKQYMIRSRQDQLL